MSNRVVRLAQLLESKYGLLSRGSEPVSENRLLSSAREDILNAFNYHFSDNRKGALSKNPKGSIFRTMAEAGDPSMVEITYKMDKMVSGMDKLSVSKLLAAINEMLALLYKIKNDPQKSVRNNIREAFRSHSQAAVKHYLSRYEDSLSRTFSLLQKAAQKLQVLEPDTAVHGGAISPQRGELTSQEIITFMQRTPIFNSYGLDSLDVIEEILQDPTLKDMLTSVINAVNRGTVPVDGTLLRDEAGKIKNMLDQKKQTNQPFFESNEPLPPPQKDEGEE